MASAIAPGAARSIASRQPVHVDRTSAAIFQSERETNPASRIARALINKKFESPAAVYVVVKAGT
jgi:hypothetical protein